MKYFTPALIFLMPAIPCVLPRQASRIRSSGDFTYEVLHTLLALGLFPPSWSGEVR